jgi:hypothetical protein
MEEESVDNLAYTKVYVAEDLCTRDGFAATATEVTEKDEATAVSIACTVEDDHAATEAPENPDETQPAVADAGEDALANQL